VSTGNDVKERVRASTDIVDLVGSYVPLQRKGRGYVGLCPWHDDSRPSLQVNQERQTWRCWVCNVGGDVFNFVMQREDVQFAEALRILADRAGISLQRRGRKAQPGSPDDKQTLYQAVAWAERIYHECLLHSHEAVKAREYLEQRGITSDSIKRYRLGYAPSGWQWLLDRASSEEFTEKVLVAAGLAGFSQTSKRHFDFFRERVLFSIRDTQARPVGFGGRILPGNPDDTAKYINSSDNRLFSKSQLLYGMDVVKDAVAKSRKLVVVEGYTDAIMAWQHGIDNVVAVLGTALGERHVQVIKRFADQVTLVLDGDEAGQRRSNEILQLFVSSPVDLRIVTLPEGQDPCDFLQAHGAESFHHEISTAVDALYHKLRIATRGLDLAKDIHGANEALEQVLGTLARIAPTTSDAASGQMLRYRQMLAHVARVFNVPEAQLRQRIQSLRRPSSSLSAHESSQNRAENRVQAMDPWDRELLQLLLRYPEFVRPALEQIQRLQLRAPFAHSMFELWERMLSEGRGVTFQNVMLEINDPALKTLLVELDEAAVHGHEPANPAIDDEAPQTDAQRQEVPTSDPSEDPYHDPDFNTDPAECFAAILAAYEARLEKEKTRSVVRRIEQGDLSEDEQLQELANLLAKRRQSI
jgi:DNA primase